MSPLRDHSRVRSHLCAAGLVACFVAVVPRASGVSLSYSTYLGGGQFAHVNALTVDAAGNTYAVGCAATDDLPVTPGAFDTTFNHPDAMGQVCDSFLAKLDAQGRVVYCTYLAGPDYDYIFGVRGEGAHAVAVDDAGCAYVAFPAHLDFPCEMLAPGAALVSGDVVAKLDPSGSRLLYAARFMTRIDALAVDRTGAAYVAGLTDYDMPLTTGLGSSTAPAAGCDEGGGGRDAYVAKLPPQGTPLLFSRRFGGKLLDTVRAIAVDADDAIWLAGVTRSCSFPIHHAIQPTLGGGADAFLVHVSPSGDEILFSTFLGGAGDDEALDLRLGPDGAPHVVGRTASSDFPSVDGLSDAPTGTLSSGFVAKLNPDARGFSYATRLPGTTEATSIAIDALGRTSVAGTTASDTLPVRDEFQSTRAGGVDGYLLRLDPSGSFMDRASYLGGGLPLLGDALDGPIDRPSSVAVDACGGVRIGGWTACEDFPIVDALQDHAPIASDATWAKVGFLAHVGGEGVLELREPSARDQRPLVPPLVVSRVGGPMQRMVVGWEETMGATYGLYVGTIDSLFRLHAYDHTIASPPACELPTPRLEVPMPPGNVYVLAVAQRKDGAMTTESSYGRDSLGNERPPALTRCP